SLDELRSHSPLPLSTASLIHDFSTTTTSSSIDGLLLRQVTFVTTLNLSDDSSDTSQTLISPPSPPSQTQKPPSQNQ
ncbi:hypothetical protein L195_g047024, partial [Trifolium pratense]